MARATWEEIDARIERLPSGCWLWHGARCGPAGREYGKIGDRYIHRVMYERHVGPIPPGLDLDHLCRVRLCVNPAHLEPVTRGENIRRGALGDVIRARAAKVTHCPRGHAYTPDNLLKRKKNERACKACHREKMLERYHGRTA